jgi:hypothetical protein
MRCKPRADIRQQSDRILTALLSNTVRNRYTPIIALIPCHTISIQNAHPIGIDAGSLRQRLDQELVMPGLAGGRAVAVGEHRSQGRLHDCSIADIQSCVRADVGHPSIREAALRGSQQSRDLRLIGDVSAELSDAKQVFLSHPRRR